jgi:predicted nucleic acid-binding protein
MGKNGEIGTTDFVLDETLTIVRDRARMQSALDSGNVHLIWIEEPHFRRASGPEFSREDKRWSVTDCTSFVLTQDLAIDAAFTFDRDFRQSGSGVLPP